MFQVQHIDSCFTRSTYLHVLRMFDPEIAMPYNVKDSDPDPEQV